MTGFLRTSVQRLWHIGSLWHLVRALAFALVITSSLSAVGQGIPAADQVGATSGDDSDVFSTEQKKALREQLDPDICLAQRWSSINWWTDRLFKWGVVIISCLVTILAALSKMDGFSARKWGVALIVLGATATALSGASSEFNFSDHQIVADAKARTLQGLSWELEYLHSTKAEFLKRLNTVRMWGPNTKVEDARLPAPTPQICPPTPTLGTPQAAS